jgi:hypothetical protein
MCAWASGDHSIILTKCPAEAEVERLSAGIGYYAARLFD